MGKVNVTEEGHACLPWTLAVNIFYRSDSYFADGSLTAAGSFCRNPRRFGRGLSSTRPWCFVEVKRGMIRNWGLCYIPQCGTCKYIWQASRVQHFSKIFFIVLSFF